MRLPWSKWLPGTVAAAREAAIGGVPGIAVSLNTPEGHQGQRNYSPAGRYAYLVAKQVISGRYKFKNIGTLFLPNVNKQTW